MKKIISKKEIRVLSIILVFTIIGIPALLIGLRYIYNANDWNFFPWSADAVLSFYGAIFAAVATVIGVYLSIQYAQKNYREDLNNQVRPYITITHLRTNTKQYNLLDFIEEDDDSQSEDESYDLIERPQHIYFLIDRKGIKDTRKLTPEQVNLIRKAGAVKTPMKSGGIAIGARDYTHIPMEIENVGPGVGINLRARLISADNQDLDAGYVVFGTLGSGTRVRITVFSDEVYNLVKGRYKLQFVYQDVYRNSFRQEYEIELEDKNEKGGHKWIIALDAPQEVVDISDTSI